MRYVPRLLVLLLLVLGCDPQAATGLSDASLDAAEGRGRRRLASLRLDATEDSGHLDTCVEGPRLDALADAPAEGDTSSRTDVGADVDAGRDAPCDALAPPQFDGLRMAIGTRRPGFPGETAQVEGGGRVTRFWGPPPSAQMPVSRG